MRTAFRAMKCEAAEKVGTTPDVDAASESRCLLASDVALPHHSQTKARANFEIRVYTHFVSSMSPLIWIVPAIRAGFFFVLDLIAARARFLRFT